VPLFQLPKKIYGLWLEKNDQYGAERENNHSTLIFIGVLVLFLGFRYWAFVQDKKNAAGGLGHV
jgi:hypothetical protein